VIDATEHRAEKRLARSLPMPAGVAITVGSLFMGLAFAIAFNIAMEALHPLRGHSSQPLLIYLCAPPAAFVGGFAFALGGARTLVRQAGARKRAALHPDEPWYADWNGDPEGAVEESKRGIKLLVTAMFLPPLGMFTYFVLLALPDPNLGLLPKAFFVFIVGVFDLVFLYLIYDVVRAAMKPRARLRFLTFPFFLGRSFEARATATALARGGAVGVSLRCLEERLMNVPTPPAHVSTRVEVFQLYEVRAQIEGRGEGDRELPITLPLPVGDYQTRFAADLPRYWVLELTVGEEKGGGDGEETMTFLVPVY
jgi:hypothetical protein